MPLNAFLEIQCSSSEKLLLGAGGGFNPSLTPLPGFKNEVQNSQSKAVRIALQEVPSTAPSLYADLEAL